MTTTAEQWERVQHTLGTVAWTPEVGVAMTDAVSLRSRMEQLEQVVEAARALLPVKNPLNFVPLTEALAALDQEERKGR